MTGIDFCYANLGRVVAPQDEILVGFLLGKCFERPPRCRRACGCHHRPPPDLCVLRVVGLGGVGVNTPASVAESVAARWLYLENMAGCSLCGKKRAAYKAYGVGFLRLSSASKAGR